MVLYLFYSYLEVVSVRAPVPGVAECFSSVFASPLLGLEFGVSLRNCFM